MLEFAQTALVTVISFLFVLTFVVTVHELGHFMAAKSFGVAVDRFSIGFGKTLFSWTDKTGVEWRIGMLPLGGYVRFAGDVNDASVPDQNDLAAMREWIEFEEGKEGLSRYFHFKPLWQRAVVVAAGPIANFLLAIVLFAILLMTVGDVTSSARVHAISAGSPAERAGFKVGDLVEKADGRKIGSTEDLARYVMLRGDVPMKIEVLRGEQHLSLSVTPVIRKVDDPISGPQDVGALGIESPPAAIGGVGPGSPAAAAGFAAGDLITAVDGVRIGSFDDLYDYVAARPDTSARFTVQRGGQPLELTAAIGTRQIKSSTGQVVTIGLLGVAPQRVEDDLRRVRYSPLAAIPAGAARTWDVLDTTVYYLGRLIRGEVSADQLGGPIRIAQASGAVAKYASQGAPDLPTMILASFVGLLGLAAILSVSIGFMNLLPVPVLDGGHLLFYAYEAVARRPLAAKVQAAGYRVGLALLLGFMLFATWNDLQRLSVFNFLGGLFFLNAANVPNGFDPMKKSRATGAAFVSGLAVLMGTTCLTAALPAYAQDAAPEAVPTPAPAAPEATPATPAPEAAASPEAAPPPAAPAPTLGVVNRIVIKGNERIEQGTVLSYLPIQVGETVDSARIDLALKTLFRTDLFADVRIELQGGDLQVTLVENPIINQVVFEGNSALKEDKLKDEVSVRPRGIFTRAKVQQDVQRIIELYRRSGRISATVTPKVVELPQKRIDLIFEINEGPKSGVLDVAFLGNNEFSDNDLLDVIVTDESHWYKFLSSNDNYDPDRIEYDREQLRKFYRNKGYYDFRIISSVAELAPEKNGFVVTYTIDEGPQYRFGKVTVETELKKLDGTILAQLLPIRTGQVYQDDKIEQATDSLTFAAGAAGFAFVDVRPKYVPNRDTKTVDVVFQVKEGPRVYVDRIDIVGNTRTLDYVVRREMNVAEGDAYNRVLVDRSKNQIRALGFFKEVDIEEIPGVAPDRTSLRVKVEEQPTGELSFSAGYSSVDQLVLDLGISERNFRGRGQAVRARVSAGSLRQQIDFSFTEPRFLGRNLSAGLDLYSYRYDFSQQTAYDTRSIGGGLRLGFPLTQNTSMALRYTLRADEVVVDDSLCGAVVISQVLCDQRGSNITSLIGYGLRVDRRNDPIRPTRGYYLDLSQDLAGVGGDVNYVRSETGAGWYYGINRDFVFSATGTAGYIEGWGGDAIRINDRFYKGGNTFRGFETAGIGPRDVLRTDALGAKLYAIGSMEMTVPTFLPEQYGIKAALFSDFGTIGLLDEEDKVDDLGRPLNVEDDLGLRASAGISIHWRSPMGPIRFDFSRVLAKEDYDKTETFRFSTSTRF